MSTLSCSEILKTNNQTNEKRTNILLRLIIKEQQITLKNGNIATLSSKQPVCVIKALQSNNQRTIKKTMGHPGKQGSCIHIHNAPPIRLSDIVKTAIFGGFVNSNGLGSKNTEYVELLQVMTIISKKDIEYTKTNIKDLLSHINHNPQIDYDELQKLYNDDSWNNTFSKTSEILNKHHSWISTVEWQRDSHKIRQIFNNFKALSHTSMLKNKNKWNPSDIWGISKEVEIPPAEDFESLDSFNNWLVMKFNSHHIIGVSLKKVYVNAKISTHNYTHVPPIDTISGKRLYINKILNSKDAYIEYTNGVIQFRSFNEGANIQGEIKGNAASHGKIGFGPLNDILKHTTGCTITPHSILSTYDSTMLKQELMYQVNTNSIEMFDGMITSNKGKNFIISKIQAVTAANIIEKSDTTIREIAKYASSTTSHSSIFTKIS